MEELKPYVLIAVDVQADFLPGGALAVPNGDEILIPLAQYAREADLVIASRDWHPQNHFSFSDDPQYVDGSWPPHCIQGTKGAKIHRSVRKYAQYTVSKGMNRNPPDAYSAFVAKTMRPVRTLEELLSAQPVRRLVIGGLAMDVCVRHTALDANALGYETIVPLELTRPVRPANFQPTLRDFERAGVRYLENVS
jgi:nicotinamidase/pyrazinamidase